MMRASLAVLSCFAALSAAALPEAPTLEKALPLAKEQGRCVFLELTGRDWCPACIHLHNKILSSDAMEQAMGHKLLVVQVDYPRKPELAARISPDEWKEREALLVSYKVEGLPAAILYDADGFPFDVIEATRPTPADYLPLLEAAFARKAARDAALAEAAKEQGTGRARALIKALDALPETCRDKYPALAAEIHRLDPNNTLGFRDLAVENRQRIRQIADIQELTRSFAGRFKPKEIREDIGRLDAFLSTPGLLPEPRQIALMAKGDCYAFLRELDNMQQAYQAALEAAPDTRLGKKLKKDVEICRQRQRQQQKQAPSH